MKFEISKVIISLDGDQHFKEIKQWKSFKNDWEKNLKQSIRTIKPNQIISIKTKKEIVNETYEMFEHRWKIFRWVSNKI